MFILEQQWDGQTVRVGTTRLRCEDECDACTRDGKCFVVPAGTTGVLVAMEVEAGEPQADPWCWVQTSEGTVFESMGNGLEVV